MKDGFIKVGVATNDIVVANPIQNAKNIIKRINQAKKEKAKIVVFPELSISGYTCLDLFLQDTLINSSLEALEMIRFNSIRKDMLIVVGLPLRHNSKLYNVAAFINKGKILGFVPKSFMPNYGEFVEARYFSKSERENSEVLVDGKLYPFGTNLLFKCKEIEELVVACEICEDLWVPLPPSINHSLNGATVICNLSASNETVNKSEVRLDLVKYQSQKLIAAYLYSSAGEGESTQDLVFSAHNIIAENGEILNSVSDLKNHIIYSEIDVKKLAFERSKMSTFLALDNEINYQTIYFDLKVEETNLTRSFPTCSI